MAAAAAAADEDALDVTAEAEEELGPPALSSPGMSLGS